MRLPSIRAAAMNIHPGPPPSPPSPFKHEERRLCGSLRRVFLSTAVQENVSPVLVPELVDLRYSKPCATDHKGNINPNTTTVPVPLHVTVSPGNPRSTSSHASGTGPRIRPGFCHRPAFSTFTRPSVALHSQLFRSSIHPAHSSICPLHLNPNPHALAVSVASVAPLTPPLQHQHASCLRLALPSLALSWTPSSVSPCSALPCFSKNLPAGSWSGLVGILVSGHHHHCTTAIHPLPPVFSSLSAKQKLGYCQIQQRLDWGIGLPSYLPYSILLLLVANSPPFTTATDHHNTNYSHTNLWHLALGAWLSSLPTIRITLATACAIVR
ncbi:hypothetical protein BGZ63DRAFT_5467 [Mariannaea sp. PMI_226]|nr:hypothetical protein BGZ63DRAFT_5467 [Mariannaea sp. PMI_226]